MKQLLRTLIRLTSPARVATLTILLAGGLVAGLQYERAVQAAACQAAHGACPGGDTTRTSALHVTHFDASGASDIPVEPDSGETWNIKAYWNEAPATFCAETSETASATVNWNSTTQAFELSNISTTNRIMDIQLCNTIGCSSTETHGYGYTLIVDITDPNVSAGSTLNLRQVVYTTTSVDDGFHINTTKCELGSSVSPTSQTWSATDTPTFECAYDCDAVGANVMILYD